MKKAAILLSFCLLSFQLLIAKVGNQNLVYETASARFSFEKSEVISEFAKFKNTSVYQHFSASEKEMYEDAIRFLSRSQGNIFLSEESQSPAKNRKILSKLLKNHLLAILLVKKPIRAIE